LGRALNLLTGACGPGLARRPGCVAPRENNHPTAGNPGSASAHRPCVTGLRLTAPHSRHKGVAMCCRGTQPAALNVSPPPASTWQRSRSPGSAAVRATPDFAAVGAEAPTMPLSGQSSDHAAVGAEAPTMPLSAPPPMLPDPTAPMALVLPADRVRRSPTPSSTRTIAALPCRHSAKAAQVLRPHSDITSQGVQRNETTGAL
jgi:hypothetical protein